MEIRKIIYVILCFFLYNCESELTSPKFEVYLCSVSNIEMELLNSSSLNITWSYPDETDQGCDESAQNFVINYLQSPTVLEGHPQTFVETPAVVPIVNQSSNNYSYALPINEINTNYYITIQTQYGGEYSKVTSNSESVFLFGDNYGLPIVSPSNCSPPNTTHDDDCQGFTINHNNLNIVDYSNLFLMEKITNSSGDVRLSSIALNQDNINGEITRDIYLDYLELCIAGNTYNDLYNCSELNAEQGALRPNVEYNVEYYYSQTIDGVSVDGLSSSQYNFIFERNELLIDSQPISNNELRVYVESNSELQYYHTLFIWDKLSENQIGSLVQEVDISTNKLNKVFDGFIHVDISGLNSGEYYVGLKGNETLYVTPDGLAKSLNVLTIPGFRLIDRASSTDYYLSTYELTNSDLVSGPSGWQSQSLAMPAEVNRADCEDYINGLNSQFSQYSFRMPSISEWEYAAHTNIYTGQTTIYPWGDIMYSDGANYYNSDYPLLYNNTNGPSPVGYFFNFPSPFGIYDMSGNLMEWVQGEGQAAVAKGGNYLSFDIDDLKVINTQSNLDANINNGMGCRILMEPN